MIHKTSALMESLMWPKEQKDMRFGMQDVRSPYRMGWHKSVTIISTKYITGLMEYRRSDGTKLALTSSHHFGTSFSCINRIIICTICQILGDQLKENEIKGHTAGYF
jgi:hypothetical protein